MAKDMQARGKLVRRFGVNIFGNPKYARLLARRSDPPGQHGSRQGRRKMSDYGLQLTEKQKLRSTYGLLEKQFRRTFQRAQRQPGVTGANLLALLETRLDNVVYRAGFAVTRRQARQLVNHGHLQVNGRKVDIPSYQLRGGDVLSVRPKPNSRQLVARNLVERGPVPALTWLTVDREAGSASVHRLPQRDEIDTPVNEQLIVELYSR